MRERERVSAGHFVPQFSWVILILRPVLILEEDEA
jgi:hypothetical protein